MSKIYLILLLLLYSMLFMSPVKAQSFEEEIDRALQSKPRFIAFFDSRGAFISRNGVRVFGIKAGLQFDEKLTFGIGFNQLASQYQRTIHFNGLPGRVELKYWYLSPFVEYTFYEDKKWELMIPVQLGLGESYYLGAQDDELIRYSWVLSYEPAIAFQYRLFDYLGAGFGVGYRLMIIPNSRLEEQFTSPVYMLKFKVYFEQLMRAISLP